ncbi:splicing factor 3B subunit 2, putative [Plasmodium knowlesi strain H]|uniref:Splicing factor 3B subunit 2, putative n=3 Tax=Plasmodium knowlesi TaxID=5850 RepID=A0A5K1VDG4_PLAKH|nr:splicing factor 3B subunit 2, putative [Plasmodium knowlesi strain H]OTN65620.1 putative Spliceosome-associated protein [Plasmodium knowlesi]CAA9989529.1 splicing factor 3B subunit 2, putative [Plasmodium knowlesi strain H]SBO22525.1 splicing factor 3B subunit 2, putative [Plasmodium knowlesi strain H]SBO23625.1 splicing factor 3B subunit 2, putative [Plasmodium knowlesi strain H]VVS79003.1 splicing factor 3B subunit 2, putative [Plasmodium knowlesi strain H]|eukprot:XP_002260254.1 spliceosome-associated protein, putative [Plasmodium knowlesi strain H]
MAVADLIDIKRLNELRRTNPTKAKNLIKKIKKKNAKKEKRDKTERNIDKAGPVNRNNTSSYRHEPYVEYVEEDIEEEIFQNFQDVYKKFKGKRDDQEECEEQMENEKKISLYDSNSEEQSDDGSDDDEEEEENGGNTKKKGPISKKALKLLNRPSVVELKEFAKKPELVEIWDTTACDPFFFVWLKCLKDSVPVPQQWCQKRKYMHGKRGIEKIPYKLPPYIEDTKISEIRQAIKEKEEQKSLKQKMRDRVRPKLHTMDIDYQTLHDAFFKYATKPQLVKFADVYYEGKEFELKTKKFRPGVISEKLRNALNIDPSEPLPWLFNMQKYGLPPSFPYLNIPGLNDLSAENSGGKSGPGNTSSLPPQSGMNKTQDDGAKGKYENVDESGNIIYGNFISQHTSENSSKYPDDFLWGEIDENYVNSEEEEDDEDDENEEEKEVDEEGKDEKEKRKKKKGLSKEQKEKMEGLDSENANLNLSEDIMKGNYSSGLYSVATNTKINGSYTPFMESGVTSVDLTSFISGYETPKYVYNNNYMNPAHIKPYTVLQKEEVPMSQNHLFSSNVKYKINPAVSIMSKSSNVSEIGGGGITPFSGVAMSTPYPPSETGRKLQINPPQTNIEDIKKELSKHEELSNKAKLVSAQVDPPKKGKKEEKKKKKKKYFKF